MKNSIVSKLILLSIVSAFALVSCEKEDNFNPQSQTELKAKNYTSLNKTNLVDSLVITTEFIGENITNEYIHHYKNIYVGMPTWTRKVNDNIDFIRNIEKTYTPTVLVTGKSQNTITLDVDGTNLTLSSVTGSQDYINFTASSQSSSRQIDFSAEVLNENLTNILDSIDVGDNIDPDSQFAWGPIIFGAAALIASAVDYYCDQKIADEAKDCASQGCGVQVGSCGATCIDVCTE